MQYTSNYSSPIGKILLAADDVGLIGAWFEGQKHFSSGLQGTPEEKELRIFSETKHWLDIYFSGNEPDFDIPLHLTGTPFQNEIWRLLISIPYGRTVTYGDIAKRLCKTKNVSRMSSQAVGYAVGRNRISVIIPCHRVIGTSGDLTGYAGGIERKVYLLDHEKKKTK